MSAARRPAHDPAGVRDLPGWVRRSWIVPLVLGLLLLLVGVILLVTIGAGVAALRRLVVGTLVLVAAEAFATASMHHRPWLGRVGGVLYLVGAVVAVAWPDVTLRVLVLAVGVCLLVAGGAQAGLAWRAGRQGGGWLWGFALGVVSVLAGLVFLLANPLISVLVLVVALGSYAIITGATLVLLARAVRRLDRSGQ